RPGVCIPLQHADRLFLLVPGFGARGNRRRGPAATASTFHGFGPGRRPAGGKRQRGHDGRDDRSGGLRGGRAHLREKITPPESKTAQGYACAAYSDKRASAETAPG